MDCSPPGSSVHGDSPAKNTEVGCPPPGDLPNPEIEPRSPRLWADSLPSEPPEKPKNAGVGSLSLLQGIFPTQESNPDLLHCWWILNCLSHQGIPLYPLGARRKGWVSHEGLWSQPALFHPALLTTVAPSFTGHYPLQANWFPLNHQVQLFFSLSRICFS